ncbi:MAG: GntR family transcriptional regulator [Marmoricola sp.]
MRSGPAATGQDPEGSGGPAVPLRSVNDLAVGERGARLQEILESWVADLPPGAALPSERELAERFGVARMTVRVQLDRLAQRGLVYRHRGRGTFVAERRLAHTEHLTSFTEDMHARGLTPGARLLGVDEIRAGRLLAARLEVSASSRVVRLRRVRTADAEPMAVETTHLPARRFPGLARQDLVGRSLYDLMATKYGIRVHEAVQRVTVTDLGVDDASLLAAPEGAAALRIERTTRDAAGTVLEFAASVYRGDRYEVLMHARR